MGSLAYIAAIIIFLAAMSGISGFIAYKFGAFDRLLRRNQGSARSPSPPTPPSIPILTSSARPIVAPPGGFSVVMGPMGPMDLRRVV